MRKMCSILTPDQITSDTECKLDERYVKNAKNGFQVSAAVQVRFEKSKQFSLEFFPDEIPSRRRIALYQS